ncbi:zinc-binding dehydrogenase [Seohaeicola zhoushanensis]
MSTAAGSVGSFVGQIGKGLGCRTIGLTGSDDKVATCRDTFGYDVAINYKTADLDSAVRSAAPGGVNVYFDNTGGAILDTVLRQMAVGGRIVQCGTAANQVWSPPPTGPRNEREIMTRRLIWSGFVIFDHLNAYARACDDLTAMHADGRLTFATDMKQGIDTAPGAIADLYAGRNSGKSLIYIG